MIASSTILRSPNSNIVDSKTPSISINTNSDACTAKHLKQQFASLWLAATNPKKLSRDLIHQESISERCQQLTNYLTPLFPSSRLTGDLSRKQKYGATIAIEGSPPTSESSLSSGNSAASGDVGGIRKIEAPSNHQRRQKFDERSKDLSAIHDDSSKGATFRLNLYMAIQMLLGVNVLFGRKVELVQKNLAGLLREFKIFMNLAQPNKCANGGRQQIGGSRSKAKKMENIDIDDFIEKKLESLVRFDNSTIFNDLNLNAKTNRYSSAGCEEIDIKAYVDNYFDNALANDEILETLRTTETDRIVEFGNDFDLDAIEKDLDCKLQMDGLQFDAKNNDDIFSRIEVQDSRLERTPHECDVDVLDIARNRSKSDIDYDRIKQRKLDYESTLRAQEDAKEKPRAKRMPKIDSSISLKSSTIKASLSYTDDIINRDIDTEHLNFRKSRVYYEENWRKEAYVAKLNCFYSSKLQAIREDIRSSKGNRNDNPNEIFELRSTKNKSGILNSYLDAENNGDVANAAKYNSSNSESSLRLRNNSQDSPHSLDFLRRNSHNDPFASINNIPDLE
ncbi:MAG: hypothetical protein MHMPM18_000482 [Marteilia pararefringens]